MFKQRKFEVFYSIILTAFTLYMVLDTFVSKEVYKVVDTTISDETNEIQVLETGKVTSNSNIYKDDTVGSIMEGVLQIYGTTNVKIYLYLIFGIILLITSILLYLFRIKNNINKEDNLI